MTGRSQGLTMPIREIEKEDVRRRSILYRTCFVMEIQIV